MSASQAVSSTFPIASGAIPLPIWYWLCGEATVNFGDALSELFVSRLFGEPRWPADVYHLVGSVISPNILNEHRAKGEVRSVAYWGCGLREAEPLPKADRDLCQFFSIRGPLSRDLLGLQADTPLGDPGFLLPLLTPPSNNVRRIGRVVAPHIFDVGPSEELAKRCGADAVVSPVAAASADAIDAVIGRIASAEFVLAGSLHAAVVAAAFDVPFAFLECGHIDIPFKWRDLAASLDIPPAFARTIEEGEIIYRELLKPRLRKPKLAPLLDACPFVVRPSMLAAAMLYDQGVPAQEALARVEALASLPGERWEARRERMQLMGAAASQPRQSTPEAPPTEDIETASPVATEPSSSAADLQRLEHVEARSTAMEQQLAALASSVAAIPALLTKLEELSCAQSTLQAAQKSAEDTQQAFVQYCTERLSLLETYATALRERLKTQASRITDLERRSAALANGLATDREAIAKLKEYACGTVEPPISPQPPMAAQDDIISKVTDPPQAAGEEAAKPMDGGLGGRSSRLEQFRLAFREPLI